MRYNDCYLHHWELGEYTCKLVMVVLLGILDFSDIELSDPTDGILLVDDRGRLTLGFTQYDVYEVL